MAGTYVEFPVTQETRELLALYTTAQLDLPAPTHGLHVTSVYSRVPIDYQGTFPAAPPYPGRVEGLLLLKGNNDLGICLALAVNCNAIFYSHRQAISLGATWDYPKFIPHITLAYGLSLDDLNGRVLSLPHFGLFFEAERVMGLDEEWKPARD